MDVIRLDLENTRLISTRPGVKDDKKIVAKFLQVQSNM